MYCRTKYFIASILLVLGIALGGNSSQGDLVAVPIVVSPEETVHTEASPQPSEPSPDSQGSTAGVPSVPAPGEDSPTPPEDPCLPPLYRDWREFALFKPEGDENGGGHRLRIVIDRANFLLSVEQSNSDGSYEQIYETHVGLGDVNSPTPEGTFVINHVYCYPDVLYFDSHEARIPNLYKGFFAPLLSCNRKGRCHRFRELGMHGYDASAYPHPERVSHQTYGPASAGCIRVPDPCTLKALLIRIVGVGPIHKNDRGCYHWLNNPVEVVIEGDYPWFDERSPAMSIVQRGFMRVQEGLKSVLGILGP